MLSSFNVGDRVSWSDDTVDAIYKGHVHLSTDPAHPDLGRAEPSASPSGEIVSIEEDLFGSQYAIVDIGGRQVKIPLKKLTKEFGR